MSSMRVLRPFVQNTLRSQHRVMSSSVRLAAEGSTGSGASRPGGTAAGDAFTKREKANEDLYVKEQEKQKLKALKDRLEQQQTHLNELSKNIEELSKRSK